MGDRAARGRRWFVAGACAAVALLLGIALWPAVRAHLQAVCVLHEVAGQPEPWFARAVTMPVTTEDFSFAIASGQTVRARMYTPRGRPDAPAMVVLHGVDSLGIVEPRLMGFARAMAGCGLRVLTPELPGIKDYHVSEDSVVTIGESVKWFALRTGGPVGVMGLSFSGGLALVAAADPEYAPDFKFVFTVGAQDSMARVVNFYGTGRDLRPDGTVEVLAPHEYGPLVLEYEHLEDFVPAGDLAPVRAVLRAHLYEDRKAEAEASLGLNETQKRETLALMDATSPAMRVRIASVVAKYAGEMADLSPEGHMRTMHVPVYLLHGAGDNVIPAAETLWVASQLPHGVLKAMLVSPVLSHVDMREARPGAMDEWRLVQLFGLVLAAAERG